MNWTSFSRFGTSDATAIIIPKITEMKAMKPRPAATSAMRSFFSFGRSGGPPSSPPNGSTGGGVTGGGGGAV